MPKSEQLREPEKSSSDKLPLSDEILLYNIAPLIEAIRTIALKVDSIQVYSNGELKRKGKKRLPGNLNLDDIKKFTWAEITKYAQELADNDKFWAAISNRVSRSKEHPARTTLRRELKNINTTT